MKIKKYRSKLVIVTVLLVVGIGIFFYERLASQYDRDYQWVEVTRGDIKELLEYEGEIKPAESPDLSFPIAGTIDHIFFAPSDQVKSGQVLITLDGSNINTEIEKLQSDLKKAESELASAQDQLNVEKEKLKALEATAGREAEFQTQTIRTDDVQTEIDTLNDLIMDLRNDLKNLEDQSQKTVLRSPINGKIIHSTVKIGQAVKANVPLISILSTDQFQVEVLVANTDLENLEAQDDVIITLQHPDDDSAQTVSSSNIDLSEIRRASLSDHRIIFRCEGDINKIKPETSASVSMPFAVRRNTLLIPKNAIIPKVSGNYVLTRAENGAVSEKTVEIGIAAPDGAIEVLSGLTEGETILSFGKSGD